MQTEVAAAHTAAPDKLWIFGLGLMLMAFVPMLLLAAARPSSWLVKIIIALDWGYVVIATVCIFLHGHNMTAYGLYSAILSALLVALFAVLQQRALTAKAREVRI
jgi:amino acid transporter